MNNEAPEFTTRCVCGIPSRTGICEHLERRVDPPAAPTVTYRLDINHQVYEDDLPADIGKALYDQWFAKSRIVDGVRVGPAVEAVAPAAPADERDEALAQQVVNGWLMQESVALTSVYGEASVLTVKKFKEALRERIANTLATVRAEGAEAQEKTGRQALAAELLGHLDRITSTTAAFHLVKNLCKVELGQKPDSLGLDVE